MESKFTPSLFEGRIYEFWEKKGLFTAQIDKKKKPFSIILPPPNANGSLHLGHAMFTYEDILIRFHKMMGYETLWLLGLDHAGFETQYVFEKHLKKLGKSRFDYKREELFQMILDYVNENKKNIKGQLRRLGFALDWSREKFTMDPAIVKIVHGTFKKLFEKGLVYRANRLINYCTYCGTSLSDLEAENVDREGLLYFINFPIKTGGTIQIATTRPETILGDVAVMVNPKDKRYQSLIGKTVVLPVSKREVPIIADEYVDMKFGTGAVKVTPNHDFNDFEIAKKHNLSYPPIINFAGRIQNTNSPYDGLKVTSAREKILLDLKELGLFVKEDKHQMVIKTCYKCSRVLEPLPKEQWFIKIKPLADAAKKLIKEKKTVIFPKRFEKQLIRILDNFIDWNISRQVVWGIRIPAYYCKNFKFPYVPQGKQISNFKLNQNNGWFVSAEKPEKCLICGACDFVQDEDTFDTWFSSAQWPFATLQTESKEFSDYFYPTSVMETGHDIMRAWVARMMMIGDFATGKQPFNTVFLHGMVRDGKGQKMSKSKGNVIDPILLMDKYGTDALRAALIFGTKEGGDVSLSEEKVKGMRNFANKIWNVGRFIELNSSVILNSFQDLQKIPKQVRNDKEAQEIIKQLQKEAKELKKRYMINMKKYRFSQALNDLHEFIWHRLADYYVEQLKDELKNGNMSALDTVKSVYLENIKMLHPFMPYVTEAVGQVFYGKETSLLQIGL
ncbi:valine--tRNA ligase [Candidatus Roizmanbacteria bacterium]|nr:valine--tRNA ligase [Candidatus Roizmanbacteria bacterium]